MDQTFSLSMQSFISFGQFSPSGRSGFMGWSLLYRYIFLSQINIFRGIAQFNHHKKIEVKKNIYFFLIDGLCDLLEQIGHQLKKLSLVHVEEIDWRAIAIITIACPNLIKLGIQNCEFMDEDDGQGEERSANDVVDPFRYKA